MTVIVETPKPRRALAVIFGLLGLAVLVALGTWQVNRLQWKEALLAKIEERVNAAPVPLADIEARNASGYEVDYTPVTAQGTWLHDKEQFFFATHQGATGWFVYTPLQLADGRAVFINRGFIPYEQKEPAKRPGSQPPGAAQVTGLARPRLDAKPSSIVPDNEPAKNVFYWKDLDAMARNAGLDPARVEPFFIDAVAGPDRKQLPVGGVTIIDLPNNHLQYAITWYGLALALAGVLAVWLWRNRRA